MKSLLHGCPNGKEIGEGVASRADPIRWIHLRSRRPARIVRSTRMLNICDQLLTASRDVVRHEVLGVLF